MDPRYVPCCYVDGSMQRFPPSGLKGSIQLQSSPEFESELAQPIRRDQMDSMYGTSILSKGVHLFSNLKYLVKCQNSLCWSPSDVPYFAVTYLFVSKILHVGMHCCFFSVTNIVVKKWHVGVQLLPPQSALELMAIAVYPWLMAVILLACLSKVLCSAHIEKLWEM